MGKLTRIGLQERRLLQPKRLRWSRLLFLVGMLVIGSTYRHLRGPQSLLSLWAEVSSQQPIKLASRDLPNDETMMVSSEPPPASSEVERKMVAPQATVGRDQAPPSTTRQNTRSPPKRKAKIVPMTPKNSHSPTAASTERAKENTPVARVLNHDSPTSGRLTVNNHTPTPRQEMKSYRPTQAKRKGKKLIPSPTGGTVDAYTPATFTTMATNLGVTPGTAMRSSRTVAAAEVWETGSAERIVGETIPATFKGIVKNTPIFPTRKAKTNTSTSPRSLVEKDAMSSPRRGGNSGLTSPQTSVGKNKPMTPREAALEHPSATSEEQVTISTVTGSSLVKTKASAAARSVRVPWPQASAPPSRAAPVTRWELEKKWPIARSSSATPNVRATPTTQVQHCMAVESAPAAPSTPSHRLTTALLPGVPTPSLSAPLPGWPEPHPKGEYPQDLFSVEERRQGWVVLHIFGMMYVFVALAIVCDEYFVPALGVITDKLQISEDVAGATFMAAGGSAPELFTSLIGVFISHSNVGIGTIVGSAVFNILFVIGTCSLFSREVLHLTWWPLFRDVSFYILDLSMLIIFFLDSLIAWWESLLLLLAYALYVFTMKWNKQIEVWVKEQLSRRPGAKILALGDLGKEDMAGAEKKGEIEEKGGGKGKRAAEGKDKREDKTETGGKQDSGETEAEGKDKQEDEHKIQAEDEGQSEGKAEAPEAKAENAEVKNEKDTDDEGVSEEDEEDEEEEEEEEEPLSLEWPETRQKQAIYLFLLPITVPLWLTVPDVRRQESRKFFVITFLGAIIWIAMFSYLMVWWAHQVGETIGISEEIMGLTILAAGTSIPDLITSVIVARKGLGDMAVSSSVGSNIFDITVGLPVPWFLYSLINALQPVPVSSNGLFCAIVLLFLMLLFVISSIALCKWRMNKILGFTMFLLYFVFLIISVMLEDRIISCPVSI